jgi:membrane protease YdiL (CAAX protease family)
MHKKAIHARRTKMNGTLSVMVADRSTTAQPVEAEQHSLRQSIILHLLPGVLLLIWFVITGPLAEGLGAPAFLALMIGATVIVIPFELGYLLYQGWQSNGKLSLEGVVRYREPIPLWQFAVFVPAGIAGMAFAFFVVAPPTDSYLIERFFTWLPDWFFGFSQAPDQYSQAILLLSVFLALAINGIVAPIVEELYFRGYLLPRLSWMPRWAPAISGLLFSLYHLFTPWEQLPRLLVVIPLGYVLQWNRNIYWGMIVHCTFNTICMLMLLVSFLPSP